MAVQGPWVGSSYVTETGKHWALEAAAVLRVGAPFWISSFIGRSREVAIDLGADHNYNKDWLISAMRAQGSTPIVVNLRGDLVSYSAGAPTLEFPSDLANEYVQLNIHGITLYGRGGNGGSNSPGGAGGHAINNWIGGRLRINNGGAIAGGGGGGGGGSWDSGIENYTKGGGGGRPFGAPGPASGRGTTQATAGTLSDPGAGSYSGAIRGGNGGQVGQAGGNASGSGANHVGGATGYAVAGQSPTWQNRGAIYGPAV